MSKFRRDISRSGATARRKTLRRPEVLRCAVASLRGISLFLLLAGLIVITGCRRDMQDQPKMKAYRGTTFFGDGLSSRQPIEGTIARGFLRTDTEYFTGKKSKASGTASAAATPVQQQTAGTQAGSQANTFPDDVDTFPFPVTKEIVERGRQRYDIFCSACHGLTGNGDGMIVRRGFRRAASFNDDRLRQAPVGHFFDAMTNGWGAMPSYASQIPVQDRWAIITYIRALQLSQQNSGAAASASPAPASATPAPAAGGHQ
ncbi:MAG TPA: cytochrome c [Pyrinomonadaceae bacterium]|nr:cytochrome c [Pyrinomonadaceae bacterium]